MTLTETLTEATGTRRYFLDGKRISRAMVVALKGDHDQDSFRTIFSKGVTRQFSCLRKRT